MRDQRLIYYTHPVPGMAELKNWPQHGPEWICPSSITIDITHDCPFRCPGCIERVGMNTSGRSNLAVETAVNLISCFSKGPGCEVLLYGGEPTLHPGFPRILRFASENVETVRVITNGAYLKRRAVAGALRSVSHIANVTVRVSLNAGTPRTHARIHRAMDFFDPVIKGMSLLTAGDSRVRLEVSYLVEGSNHMEISEAIMLANDAGASDFYLRPKTGLHGIGLESLTFGARSEILRVVNDIYTGRFGGNLKLHVEPWFIRYLKDGILPDTTKSYSACFFCAASRLVVTPPDPGVVWACTYWRGSPKFHIANLDKTPFGSVAFEQCRIRAIQRIRPWRDCREVICNRNETNMTAWNRLREQGVSTGAQHWTDQAISIQ